MNALFGPDALDLRAVTTKPQLASERLEALDHGRDHRGRSADRGIALLVAVAELFGVGLAHLLDRQVIGGTQQRIRGDSSGRHQKPVLNCAVDQLAKRLARALAYGSECREKRGQAPGHRCQGWQGWRHFNAVFAEMESRRGRAELRADAQLLEVADQSSTEVVATGDELISVQGERPAQPAGNFATLDDESANAIALQVDGCGQTRNATTNHHGVELRGVSGSWHDITE